jgi:hypothetical protein
VVLQPLCLFTVGGRSIYLCGSRKRSARVSGAVDRSRTSLFTGADEEETHRKAAREVALRLAPSHSELGYSLIVSAAAYVIRDGRAPKDAPVLQEARRRQRWLEAVVRRRAERAAA